MEWITRVCSEPLSTHKLENKHVTYTDVFWQAGKDHTDNYVIIKEADTNQYHVVVNNARAAVAEKHAGQFEDLETAKVVCIMMNSL